MIVNNSVSVLLLSIRLETAAAAGSEYFLAAVARKGKKYMVRERGGEGGSRQAAGLYPLLLDFRSFCLRTTCF